MTMARSRFVSWGQIDAARLILIFRRGKNSLNRRSRKSLSQTTYGPRTCYLLAKYRGKENESLEVLAWAFCVPSSPADRHWHVELGDARHCGERNHIVEWPFKGSGAFCHFLNFRACCSFNSRAALCVVAKKHQQGVYSESESRR